MGIRVLVVDDSAFMRKILTDLIGRDVNLSVVGTARNGLDAIKRIEELKPDVVTMDIEMPEMSGLEALEKIMDLHPLPVIMVSSLSREGAKETIKALELGAVDFITKPSGSISLDMFKTEDDLHEKIHAAAKVKLGRLTTVKPYIPKRNFIPQVTPSVGKSQVSQIVAIGTSTGGPKALNEVLTALPSNLGCPILVVQHMPPKFTQSLAQRLDASCCLTVKEAENNEEIQNNVVYIAPGGYHMECVQRGSSYYIELHQKSTVNNHRPSVDTLLESINKIRGVKRHYVIMTGMGGDGASALTEGKKMGVNTTIAESEETCVVFGMPRVAIELGGVDHIVPLYNMAAKISQIVKN